MTIRRKRWAIFTVAACLGSGIALGASEADSRTEAALQSSYTFQHELKDDDIAARAANGVVTLSGTVSTSYHKFLAGQTASSLPGVIQVENRLAVRPGQPEARSDAWITLKVKAALAIHFEVSALSTRVATERGVVTLSGDAVSQRQRQEAALVAGGVKGVKRVLNRLQVFHDRFSA
jgi:osmotically-inducible protein OsmY